MDDMKLDEIIAAVQSGGHGVQDSLPYGKVSIFSDFEYEDSGHLVVRYRFTLADGLRRTAFRSIPLDSADPLSVQKMIDRMIHQCDQGLSHIP
jgi:hypothetical protein